ncbi:MAG: hypothetical protein RMY62_015965 [Nostoc sp. ZfuVER08]|nr:hypothetical protein [Nostoc punctiforme]MDZ8010281.1 hypothetical protein [Nostoc sp. ZfuVER08]
MPLRSYTDLDFGMECVKAIAFLGLKKLQEMENTKTEEKQEPEE